MRAGVGHQARPGQDGVLQGGDVGEPAQDLGIGADQVPVEVGEELVAVESADHRQDGGDVGIGEGVMEVRDPGGDGGGIEVVALVDVTPVGEGQPHAGEARVDHLTVVVLQHERSRPRRSDHPDGVAAVQLRREAEVHGRSQ